MLREIAVLGLACSACADSHEAPSLEHSAEVSLVPSCSVAASAQFFFETSQGQYDLDPTDVATLATRSVAIVRGHVASLSPAEWAPPPLSEPAIVFKLVIDRAYKGDVKAGDPLYLAYFRAPYGPDREIEERNRSIPSDEVTLFLRTGVRAFKHTSVPQGTPVYELASPQGFVVSSSCGVAQPFYSQSIFDESVQSSDDVDRAVQEVVP